MTVLGKQVMDKPTGPSIQTIRAVLDYARAYKRIGTKTHDLGELIIN